MGTRLTPVVQYLRRLTDSNDSNRDGDWELLERFTRCHDQAAFAAVVARHGPMVLNVCRRILGDAQASEDALQATFLVLARKAASLRRPERLAAWLHGVAYRVAQKARTSLRRHAVQGLPDEERMPTAPAADPLSQLTARELLLALEEELQRLPEVERLPIVLVCLEGLSREEAAQRLGCTPGSVKGRLERGRQRLQRRLVRRGLTLSAALAAAEVGRAAASAVSATLMDATVKGALCLAAGQAVGGVISTRVVALMEGVVQGMAIQKSMVIVVVVLAMALVGAGAGALTHQLHARQDAQQKAAESPRPIAPPEKPAKPPAPEPLDKAVEAQKVAEDRAAQQTAIAEKALRRAQDRAEQLEEVAMKTQREARLAIVGEEERLAAVKRQQAAEREREQRTLLVAETAKDQNRERVAKLIEIAQGREEARTVQLIEARQRLVGREEALRHLERRQQSQLARISHQRTCATAPKMA